MRDMPPEEELRYYQLAKQHRFLPLIHACRPELPVNGATGKLDRTEYDRRLARHEVLLLFV